VIGGTGLVGSHVLWLLAQQGPVMASGRTEKNRSRVRSLFLHYDSVRGAEFYKNISWIDLDILDVDALQIAMKSMKKVFHCAALVSFHRIDFYRCITLNRDGTANVVNACLSVPGLRLCYVSSTAAVGINPNGEITETCLWKSSDKNSGYSVSKFGAEKEVWRGIEEGLQAVIVNPCVILGPAAPGSPSLQMLETAKKGLRFYTSGSNSVVDARDVAWAMVRLTEAKIHASRFLVVGPQQSFKDLFSALAQQLGKKAPTIAAPKTLTLFFAAFHELWCHISGKRNGLTIETARSAHEVLNYERNKIENQLSFRYTPLDEIIQNMIAGQAYIEQKIKP